jgi:hypothetical protein
MNTGTTNGYIKDLQEENHRLLQAIVNLCNEMIVLESERDDLRRQLDKVPNPDQPAFLRDEL